MFKTRDLGKKYLWVGGLLTVLFMFTVLVVLVLGNTGDAYKWRWETRMWTLISLRMG